jgi:hypothetical protein
VQLRNSTEPVKLDLVVIGIVAAMKRHSRPPRKRHAYLCPIQTTPRVNPGREDRANPVDLARFPRITRNFSGISWGIFTSKEARLSAGLCRQTMQAIAKLPRTPAAKNSAKSINSSAYVLSWLVALAT